MAKGKKIEIHPKRRRTNNKAEDRQIAPQPPEIPNRIAHPESFSHEKIRPRKPRHRSHHDWTSMMDTYFTGNELNKRILITVCIIAVASICVGTALHQWYAWRKAQYVRTPVDLPRLSTSNTTGSITSELFWGTYRPGLYFGLRHRTPNSLLFGLIWVVHDIQNFRFRHECEPNNGVNHYTWSEHDGRNFGVEQIDDLYHRLTITFVKRLSSDGTTDWTVRISVSCKNETGLPKPITLLAYVYHPVEGGAILHPSFSNERLKSIQGQSTELGEFKIAFHPTSQAIQLSAIPVYVPREDAIMTVLLQHLGIQQDSQLLSLFEGNPAVTAEEARKQPNSWLYQTTVIPRSSHGFNEHQDVLEIAFTQSQDLPALIGSVFTARLDELSRNFHQLFEERFDFDQTRYSPDQIQLAKKALSNLIGGIGYFYGSSLVSSPASGVDPVAYWPSALHTATPSRSNFPRGFLWDEGFHNLLLVPWDFDLVIESLSHWLDLLNTEGWIPREQILGPEDLARVPIEFVVQRNNVANPPTLILVIESLLDRLPKLSSAEVNRFRRWSIVALARLHVWYQWFNTTQTGPLPLSYRWRGRKASDMHQLNPLTLSSGFDDYPRASHPTPDERHLDLRCWMAVFARVMTRLSSLVAQYLHTDSSATKQKDEARSLSVSYARWADVLLDQGKLDDLHWSSTYSRYADWGLHTDAILLVRPTLSSPPVTGPNGEPPPPPKKIRQVNDSPKSQFVTSAMGYASFFPLLLRLLPPESPRLDKLLDDLGNEELLWSPFGLRSLARTSVFYQRANTEDDPPYWRGAIWLNMNYLAVRSLKYYANHSKTEPLVANKAALLASRLTSNLVQTVLGEFSRTGFLWEQYNDVTGLGQRAHPFAGWTSLITLIMAEVG